DELQLILFDRSKKSLKLTDAGKIFFEQCNEIVNLYKDLPVVMDNLLGVKTGHLKIGLSPIMNVKKLIKILADFHNCYPNI
ncbi:LysR family transcriptional regulator, partial [Klebsiella pneumoniae]|nr:LysR family transcriptional regulator [Klebsiella pneumoniae]